MNIESFALPHPFSVFGATATGRLALELQQRMSVMVKELSDLQKDRTRLGVGVQDLEPIKSHPVKTADVTSDVVLELEEYKLKLQQSRAKCKTNADIKIIMESIQEANDGHLNALVSHNAAIVQMSGELDTINNDNAKLVNRYNTLNNKKFFTEEDFQAYRKATIDHSEYSISNIKLEYFHFTTWYDMTVPKADYNIAAANAKAYKTECYNLFYRTIYDNGDLSWNSAPFYLHKPDWTSGTTQYGIIDTAAMLYNNS